MPSLEYYVKLAQDYKNEWSATRLSIDKTRIECAQNKSVFDFEQRVAAREDTGADLRTAWHFLIGRVRDTERTTDWGLLEVSLVCDTHRAMFQDNSFPAGMTPPGELSQRPRYCDLPDGTRLWYPVPDDMEEALASLLDYYNTRYDSRRDRYDLSLFRTCASLISHFLALHPFADGNGRLAQVLCSYALAEHHPFPVPVCDADNYLSRLMESQSSGDVDALAACVAQSSCRAWQTFTKLVP